MTSLLDSRDRRDRIDSLIRRLHELGTSDADRDRYASSTDSDPKPGDSEFVLAAKLQYKETVAAARLVYDLSFISALEAWIEVQKGRD